MAKQLTDAQIEKQIADLQALKTAREAMTVKVKKNIDEVNKLWAKIEVELVKIRSENPEWKGPWDVSPNPQENVTKIKDFLKENPDSTVKQIVDGTGLPVKKVTDLVNKGVTSVKKSWATLAGDKYTFKG